MKIKKRAIKSASLLLTMVVLAAFTAIPSMAQQAMPQQQGQDVRSDFSGQELENFVEVVKVQQEKEVQMIQAIQDEGLDLQKFNEILQAQQNPEAAGDNITEEEMGKFDKASQEVVKLQQEMQMEVMQAINDSGLGVETYQEIMLAYQTHPEVQKEVDMLLGQK